MKHYCIYTVDLSGTILAQLRSLDTPLDIHLNRTRFYLDSGQQNHREFWLRYSHIMRDISHETNHSLGT